MKYTFKMQDLECAVCAAKMEDGIRRLEGVKSVSISFIMQKMTLELEDGADLKAVLDSASRICKKTEPDCRIVY